MTNRLSGIRVNPETGNIPKRNSPVGIAHTLTDGISVWDHTLQLNGTPEFSCVDCDMQEEVPDVLRMEDGFREVVYKLYLLGKFKNSSCDTTQRVDKESEYIEERRITRGMTFPFTVRGERYRYKGENQWVVMDSSYQNPRTSITTWEVIKRCDKDRFAAQFGADLLEAVGRRRREEIANHRYNPNAISQYDDKLDKSHSTEAADSPVDSATSGDGIIARLKEVFALR